MEPRQIFNLIKTEQSQTVAFVLSYLENDKAGPILGMFNQELREEVIERLGMLEPTSLEIINKVANSLSKNLDTGGKVTMNRSGGVRMVADLLNTLEKDDSKEILSNIEERNPTLGSEIRKKMFSFDDLIRLELPDLQRIMREVDSGDLTIFLKSASESLRDFIMQAVSREQQKLYRIGKRCARRICNRHFVTEKLSATRRSDHEKQTNQSSPGF